jgi:hypothetical protein
MTRYRDCKVKEVQDVCVKSGRKPYVKPELLKYGDVKKLTEGSGGTKYELGQRIKL